MAKDQSYGKCHECGKLSESHKLTICDQCLQKFCDDHIFVGVDTGELHLKNFCKICMEEVSEANLIGDYSVRLYDDFTQKKSLTKNKVDKRHHRPGENKQINVPLLQKDLLETVSAGVGGRSKFNSATKGIFDGKNFSNNYGGYSDIDNTNAFSGNFSDRNSNKTTGYAGFSKGIGDINSKGLSTRDNVNNSVKTTGFSTKPYRKETSTNNKVSEDVKNQQNNRQQNNGQQNNRNERKSNIVTKWEYKTVFLAIDSDVEIDEQMLSHIQRDYLNVFPADRNSSDAPSALMRTEHELVLTNRLNELGNMGWEVVTSIPKTKSIVMTRKNGKPESSVSANIIGAYIVLKREKVSYL